MVESERTYDLRIGLIGDIHNGPDYDTKLGGSATTLLDRALRDLEDADVDLVVDLGDRITNGTIEEDRKRLREIAAVWRTTTLPRFHLHGNHDLHRLTPRDHEDALGLSCRSVVEERLGFSLVFWQASVAIGPRGFELEPADLEWLADALESVHGPAVLFSHVPISDASMAGNYYFQQYPGGAGNYTNATEAREVVNAQSSVTACIAGHVHWNTIHTVHGVRHLTVQSLTEGFATGKKPAEARSILSLSPERLHLEVRGRDPFELSVPTRYEKPAWLAPLTERLSTEH